MQKQNRDLQINEASIAVSFTGLMTAVSIFFAGLLIAKSEQLNELLKIPILYLILSTFGFLFATLMYANSSGDVARGSGRSFNRAMMLGNIISEYLGVYLLVLAIPLVMLSVTQDALIRLMTFLSAVGGLVIYHASGLAIMDRHFPKTHYVWLALFAVAEVCLTLTYSTPTVYLAIATVLVLTIISLAISASLQKHERLG